MLVKPQNHLPKKRQVKLTEKVKDQEDSQEEASWLITKQTVSAGPDLENSTDDESFDEEKESQNFLTGNLH